MNDHSMGHRRGLWRILFAALTAVCAVTFGMTAASASSNIPFAGQAARAGLNAGQAKALQARVDGYLARSGGKQTAANEISYQGNGTLTLALPGEETARSLNPANALAFAGCNYYRFCAYSGSYFTGDMRWAEQCNVNVGIPFTSTNGSWVNNQTPGTRAKLKGSNGAILSWTAGAYSEQQWGVNWGPVYYIDAC
ncbi:hypothetical protein ACIQWR_33920 [Streptomyces sp. NPDC098789]|uniref:hypothetical protein n=1 Tax=Streptomyces sp. NPDC098789 TaxID=3366098 RepID=UPI0037F16E56